MDVLDISVFSLLYVLLQQTFLHVSFWERVQTFLLERFWGLEWVVKDSTHFKFDEYCQIILQKC